MWIYNYILPVDFYFIMVFPLGWQTKNLINFQIKKNIPTG